MTERNPAPMEDWTTTDHIAEACRLLDAVYQHGPDGTDLLTIEQAQQQAQVHADLAQAKAGRS